MNQVLKIRKSFIRSLKKKTKDFLTDDLSKIADRYETDKGLTAGMKHKGHKYTPLYNKKFKSIRNKKIRLLEIGLLIGGPELEFSRINRELIDVPSIRMWLDYFRHPETEIFGFDICDFSEFKLDRFTFIQGDQGKEQDICRIIEKIKQNNPDESEFFDLIIDDGSHASYHQQLCFNILFPYLKKGGTYIIEDLSWQPDNYQKILPQVPATAELLRSNKIPDDYLLKNLYSKNLPEIKSIKIYTQNELGQTVKDKDYDQIGFITRRQD